MVNGVTTEKSPGSDPWVFLEPKSEGEDEMKFSELTRILEDNGFAIIRKKGSIRYYGKDGWDRLVRVDYHGPKEVPTGTCHAILKAAGIKK
jgi:predicted RNA binding protein YcfA (HicA-like mRNA interferase family)